MTMSSPGWIVGGGRVAGRLERAVAVAQEHADAAADARGARVHRGDVRDAVPVEVARLHADKVVEVRADGVIDRRDERRHAAVFEGFDVEPMGRGPKPAPSPVTA